jgi:hypothetical protein
VELERLHPPGLHRHRVVGRRATGGGRHWRGANTIAHSQADANANPEADTGSHADAETRDSDPSRNPDSPGEPAAAELADSVAARAFCADSNANRILGSSS